MQLKPRPNAQESNLSECARSQGQQYSQEFLTKLPIDASLLFRSEMLIFSYFLPAEENYGLTTIDSQVPEERTHR